MSAARKKMRGMYAAFLLSDYGGGVSSKIAVTEMPRLEFLYA